MVDNEAISYSPDRAAELLGVGRTYLYELIGDGRLDARKLGKRTLITRASLRQLIEAAPAARINMGKAPVDRPGPSHAAGEIVQ